MPAFEPDRLESRDRRELVAPLAFVAFSFLLSALPVSLQQDISFALRRSILAPFVLTQEALQEARIRAWEVSEIQVRMDSLTALLHARSTVVEENRRLRALLDLRDQEGMAFLPASAVRPGTKGSESMFLLDVGAEDGVSVNDPVVVQDGLVGVVREVSPGTALAMDWTHPDFRVSVMTEDGEAFGFVLPHLGVFREEDRLLLDGVPYYTPVAIGTRVVTSGMGSVYPRGVLVGEVIAEAEEDAGWRKSYWLKPAVAPGSATHVLVLTRPEALGVPLEEVWRRETGSAFEEGVGSEAFEVDGGGDDAGRGASSGVATPQGGRDGGGAGVAAEGGVAGGGGARGGGAGGSGAPIGGAGDGAANAVGGGAASAPAGASAVGGGAGSGPEDPR